MCGGGVVRKDVCAHAIRSGSMKVDSQAISLPLALLR